MHVRVAIGVIASSTAFASTFIYVPVEAGLQWVQPADPRYIAGSLEDATRRAESLGDAEKREFALQLAERNRRKHLGEWVSLVEPPGGAAIRYAWIWARRPIRPSSRFGDGVIEGDRIRWEAILPVQALVTLLGGGVVAWLVRLDRRRRTPGE